ncbi:MAG: hypothetical protein ACYDEN_09755, partial [Acidimicrobiales bacterium]
PHLTFFDAEAKDALLAEGGMVELAVQRVLLRPDETEVDIPDADPAVVAELSEDLDALTYQFVITAAPEGSKLVDDPPLLPAATAQAVALEALARAQWAEARLAELEPRAAAAARLLPQLAELRRASQARRERLRMLLTALGENLERIRAALADRSE